MNRATRAQVRELVEVSRGRERRLCLVEGPLVLGEALEAGHVPALVAVTKEVAVEQASLLARCEAAGSHVVVVDGSVAARISDRRNAPGLIAGVPRPRPWAGTPPATGRALVPALWGLQDPGNVGTLLRSARAFGACGCLLTLGGADPFGPKVVRASAGAVFGLPCVAVDGAEGLVDHVAGWDLELVEAATGDEPADPSVELPARCLLVLGHETRGPPGLPGARRVRVPHERTVESLNVAMAGSILMADWYRTHHP